MAEPIQIYVNNTTGSDSLVNPDRSPRTTAGNRLDPVESADRAFGLLPPSWKGAAEIIFVSTGFPYRINTSAIYLGTPIGPEASSLVIRADGSPYRRISEFSAAAPGPGDDIVTADVILPDVLIGATLGRLGSDGWISGRVVPIRGNTGSDAPSENFTIRLQRPLTAIAAADRFAVERPGVVLVPQQTLTITSHDGRSPNLRLIGIAIEPVVDAGLATSGESNGQFGMNVRYGSRAFVGPDVFDLSKLKGTSGEVALDDTAVGGGWEVVARGRPAFSNQRLSVVGVNR